MGSEEGSGRGTHKLTRTKTQQKTGRNEKEQGMGTHRLTYTKTQTTRRSEEGGGKGHTETDPAPRHNRRQEEIAKAILIESRSHRYTTAKHLTLHTLQHRN